MKIAFTSKSIGGSPAKQSRKDTGAELIFMGRVRDMENGVPIVGLEYEYYPEMAENMLTEIAQSTIEKFEIQDLECIHRIGPVLVGEPSVKITIRSRNRVPALKAMDWFILQLKSQVPIWKWGITRNGNRFPSDTMQLDGMDGT